MKRKIYLICYAVLQMLASVYTMFNANSIAKESLKMIKDAFKEMPAEMQTMINEVYTLDSMVSSVWMTAIVALVLGAILLWLFVRDRVPVKKGLAITLTVISMLLGVNDIVTLLAVVAFVLIIGIALFNLGADMAMTPMGEKVGSSLTKTKKVSIMVAVAFVMGLLITIAEPDVSVLASQVSSVLSVNTLIYSIGLGVGLFLVLSVLKIVFKKDLSMMLMQSIRLYSLLVTHEVLH